MFEVGISIDVKQILYYLTQDRWDPAFRQVTSFYLAYGLDIGPQVGLDLGLTIAYHTGRVTQVNGMGWGLSLEGAAGYAGGVVSSQVDYCSC